MIWELMKAQRTGIYPDLRTKYIADAFKNTSSTITEMSGELPLAFVTTGLPLTNYKAYGNAVQAATPSSDNPVEVQAVGDKTGNLFDKSKQAGTIYVTETAIRYGVEIPVEAGIYTIAGGTKNVFVKEKYGITYGTASDTSTQRVITLPQNGYILIYAARSEDYTVSNIMFNEGETALPYEPYGYKIPFTTAAEDGSESITTTVYLDKPLYKIGDYADCLAYAEQKAERYIKELVLTGEEDWTYITGGKHWTPVTTYQKSGLMCTCSHYEAVKNGGGSSFVANGQVGFYSTAADRLIFCNTNYTTTEDWKSYLAAQYAAGTPVKVWYVLQTPETESVELPKLPTLDGVTVIDAATAVKPSKMDIKYTGHRLLMFSRRD